MTPGLVSCFFHLTSSSNTYLVLTRIYMLTNAIRKPILLQYRSATVPAPCPPPPPASGPSAPSSTCVARLYVFSPTESSGILPSVTSVPHLHSELSSRSSGLAPRAPRRPRPPPAAERALGAPTPRPPRIPDLPPPHRDRLRRLTRPTRPRRPLRRPRQARRHRHRMRGAHVPVGGSVGLGLGALRVGVRVRVGPQG